MVIFYLIRNFLKRLINVVLSYFRRCTKLFYFVCLKPDRINLGASSKG